MEIRNSPIEDMVTVEYLCHQSLIKDSEFENCMEIHSIKNTEFVFLKMLKIIIFENIQYGWTSHVLCLILKLV